MENEISLYIDESGNFGTKGRYFTISSLRVSKSEEKKFLRNIRKIMLKLKRKFPNSINEKGEIKSSKSGPVAKDYFFRKMLKNDFLIDHITVDLDHLSQSLKDNQNILYNYLLSYLILPITKHKEVEIINIYVDDRTMKVEKIDSFEDYIKTKIWFDCKRPDIKINFEKKVSENDVGIQAADFFANSIWCKFEYEYTEWVEYFKKRIKIKQHFPWQKFAK